MSEMKANPYPGGSVKLSPSLDLRKDENLKVVESNVSDVKLKEIVLTRDDFEQLSSRLNRPVPLVVTEEKGKIVFVFVLPLLYFILVFKDDRMPELVEGFLKVLLFGFSVYYIMYDDTLKSMRVNITLRILIGFCLGGLLVAASTV